ncbi:MAG TPA: S9 family peptidase [Thermomicrobiales bacterium]|jgi:dipeptidyl aminopeptidase/acylaminoacyl peptidase
MPREDAPKRYAFDQFTAIRRYQPTLAFSPDGAAVAYSTNTSGQFNVWRQPSSGGYPRQLTLYTEQAVRDIAWSPDGETILFTADTHGDEFYQIYAISERGGQPEAFVSEPDVQHYLADGAWSPDGRLIAYAGNDREPTDQDVVIRDVTSGETRRLLAGDANYFAAEWSPDGTWLTAIKVNSNTDNDIYLVSRDGGTRHILTPHEGEVQYLPGPWKRDGSGFYMVTDEGREFMGLALYDLASGSHTWDLTPDWDIEHVAAASDGSLLAWCVNEDGYSRLNARDERTGEAIDLPAIPNGVVQLLKVSPDGTKIGLMLSRATHPAEIYVLDVPNATVSQITDGFLGGIDEADLIEPELVRFPTFDGKQIPAFLYRPKGNGPFAAVLSIHGGPEYQERPAYQYSGLYQYLLSRGIGILATNIRGSTGYGKTYQKLIHRDFGGDDLKDFEAATKYLQSLPWVDPKRLGVYGGSYGGFATLSCVSRLPDYWAAAVDIVGPSNLVTFAKAVPPTWRRFMADWVGDPETEADFLTSRSPITYVDQIKAPLFVIQGANDPRVVQSESDQIVERLRARGVPVKYDVYDDEGHGFTKRANELKAFRDTAEFLETHLAR